VIKKREEEEKKAQRARDAAAKGGVRPLETNTPAK